MYVGAQEITVFVIIMKGKQTRQVLTSLWKLFLSLKDLSLVFLAFTRNSIFLISDRFFFIIPFNLASFSIFSFFLLKA